MFKRRGGGRRRMKRQNFFSCFVELKSHLVTSECRPGQSQTANGKADYLIGRKSEDFASLLWSCDQTV